MPAPAAYISHGEAIGWDGAVSAQRRAGALDSLRGTYTHSSAAHLVPGSVVPDYPGMYVEDVTEEDGGAGSIAYRISALGDLAGSRPGKLLSDKRTRTNDPVWDSSQREWVHDAAEEVSGTTTASTDLVTATYGHRYVNTDQVIILAVGTSCGLTVGSTYYVIDADQGAGTFKLSTSSGGSAVNISADTTVSLVHKSFARGQAHPIHPGMFIMDVDTDEKEDLPFANVRVGYKGMYGLKPYKRTISVNGQKVSNDALIVNVPDGTGWATARKGSIQMPNIVVTDTQVFSTDPNLYSNVPTSDVLNSLGTGGRTIPSGIVIPDPPTVNTIFASLTGDVREQWPRFWSFIGIELVDNLPGSTVVMMRKTWSYEWRYVLA